MSIWQAFGFVALGMALEWAHNRVSWLKYYEGRREANSDETKRKVR